MTEPIVNGFTYQQMKDAGWTDELLLADPNFASLVPTTNSAGVPPAPPSAFSAFTSPETSAMTQEMNVPIGNIPNNTIPNQMIPNVEPVVSMPTSQVSSVPNANTQSPPLTAINTFTPDNEAIIIGEITPAHFDNMMKVLNVIIKERATDNIIIRSSRIKQGTSDCIIEADMTRALNYKVGNEIKMVDLDIINPKKYVSLFTQFRSDNNIFITDDSDQSRYIVTNGEIRLFLPKQDSELEQKTVSIDTVGSQVICKRTIDKETRKIIKNLAKDQGFIEYLIQDNVNKAIHIPDTAIFIFEDHLKDKKALKLDETNSELTLRSSSFLPIEADSYDINILKLADNSYATVTQCKIGGVINVQIIELVDDCTGGNILL